MRPDLEQPPPPKRKRGRPRILDKEPDYVSMPAGKLTEPVVATSEPDYSMTPLQQALTASTSLSATLALSNLVSATSGGGGGGGATSPVAGQSINELAERLFFEGAMRARNGDLPTPGGPLTEDRIKRLGVVKLNDYLANGTRPQFWEEHFVKVIMHVSFAQTHPTSLSINLDSRLSKTKRLT